MCACLSLCASHACRHPQRTECIHPLDLEWKVVVSLLMWGCWEPHSQHSVTAVLSLESLFYFLNGYWKNSRLRMWLTLCYSWMTLAYLVFMPFFPSHKSQVGIVLKHKTRLTPVPLLPLSQYSDEFVQSAYLSRRLAYFCARRLSLLLSDSPNLLAAHSPHMIIGANNTSIGTPSPGTPGPGMSPMQLAFSDFLSCAQHGPLVYGLSCMLQVSL